jgi:hypothetical protein
MVVMATNMFHDNNVEINHIGRLNKVCITNGKDTNAHKL